MNDKAKRLLNGETFETREKGNSMAPLIYSNQKHILAPIKIEDVEIGDIVYCRVGRTYYTHKVIGKDKVRGLLIGNNKGFVNGWTKKVYGKVIEVINE